MKIFFTCTKRTQNYLLYFCLDHDIFDFLFFFQTHLTSSAGVKHKNNFLLLSALKGFNPKSATFRQHYYPEGGWGWIICVCAVIVEIFTSGIQLSFGVLYVHILRKFGNNNIMPTGNYCSCLQSKVILLSENSKSSSVILCFF